MKRNSQQILQPNPLHHLDEKQFATNTPPQSPSSHPTLSHLHNLEANKKAALENTFCFPRTALFTYFPKTPFKTNATFAGRSARRLMK